MLESNGDVARAEIIGCGVATELETAVSAACTDAGLSADDVDAMPSIEELCGNLAGAATIADINAALIRGLKGPTLIATAEEDTAVAIIVKPV
jgi:hypothetical protein